MFAYFKAIEKAFVIDDISLWQSNSISNVINTTIGYETLMDLLKYILMSIPDDDSRFKIETYRVLVDKASALDFKDIERYRKTSSSKKILLEDLKNAIGV